LPASGFPECPPTFGFVSAASLPGGVVPENLRECNASHALERYLPGEKELKAGRCRTYVGFNIERPYVGITMADRWPE
jgi:hypothetical protein